MESAEARSDPRFAWFERAAFWVAMASCILLLLFTLAEIAALLYFCSKLTIASWNNNIRTQGILRTPIVYPQVGMVIGLALMWISALLVLVSETRALARPKPEASRS